MNYPEPFLKIPFSSKTSFSISEGWLYDEEEKQIHPDIPIHFAIDFKTKRGTPVYAAADGYAISSYHLAYAGKWQGKTVGFGLGNFIQAWNEKHKKFVLYAHLEKVSPDIPYFAPEKRAYEEGIGWYPEIVNKPLREVLSGALPIKQGDLIGYAGDTGLTWGYSELPRYRPDPQFFPTWDPAGPHLHFEVYERDEKGEKTNRLDPFGLYGLKEAYGQKGRFNFGQQELWLLDENGQPMFAR